MGPAAVSDAVLEAAARLFAESGVDAVSLRDIARAADVQLALIGRYVGNRQAVLDRVYLQLSAQVTAELEAKPLQQLDYGKDSVIGRWLALSTHYMTHGQVPPSDGANPVRTLAAMFEDSFGLEPRVARIRGAQVAAVTIGWRLFEEYFLASGEFDPGELDELREDVTAIQRRIASTPWPTPPASPEA